MDKKIRFRDLSGSLKTAIVFAYIVGGFYILAFVAGFLLAIVEELL
jgi:hypothetical protein